MMDVRKNMSEKKMFKGCIVAQSLVLTRFVGVFGNYFHLAPKILSSDRKTYRNKGMIRKIFD